VKSIVAKAAVIGIGVAFLAYGASMKTTPEAPLAFAVGILLIIVGFGMSVRRGGD